MANRDMPGESWEKFDAAALFPPPRLHANHLTKVDKKEMTKVDAPEDRGEMSGSSNPEEIGDTYSDAPVDQNHVDEMFEMDGLDGGTPDDRDLQADKEIDQRTQEPEQSEPADDDPSNGDEQTSQEQDSAQTSDNGSESAESEGSQETQPSDESGNSEPTESEAQADDKEGTDDPIQKESEGVEEVAEATSKTSEDVHGGDESTKDIEDSPNAADDGQNHDNEGAESGEGGEDGEGDGASEDEGGDADSDGSGSGEGSPDGDADDSDVEGEVSGDPFATEDWEAKADHSATALKLMDDLEKVEAKARNEKGHRTTLPQYNFDREASPAELEIAFKKAAELLKKFAAEEEITAHVDGRARWDAEEIVRSVVTYRHQRIPSSKYEHPKEADICLLLDISGSCAQQAEMFMAIAAGSIGNGVRVFVGYNGSCRAAAMNAPKRPIRSYAKAKPWVQSEVERVAGWHNEYNIGEWSFDQFLNEAAPKTVIIFGDWDGIDQYTAAVKNPKFRNSKFFWFANEDYGSWRSVDAEVRIPDGFTTKNYMPGIFTPRDFVKALRRLK